MISGLDGYLALTQTAGAVRIDRDVVTVEGPDAVSFLQGQLSQDLLALGIGQSAWSLVLQPQGRVDAWLRVTRSGADALLLDLDGGCGAALVARLSRFKLRVDASITALEWGCVAVRGAGVAPPDGSIRFAWRGFTGYDLLAPAPVLPEGIPEVDLAVYEVCRIEAGLPRMGAELTERTIPAEVGLVDSSVSFTKGCYTGQELVARIDSRGGNVPHRLRAITIAGSSMPESGADITVGGRSAGELTSVAPHPRGGGIGLALIRRDVDPPVDALCGDVPVRIEALA